MRRAVTILGVALALGVGVTAAVALGAGGGSKDNLASTTSKEPGKVSICHHTGSWKHPYHLIHISTHALPAHMRHGDVTPGANDSCPTTQPAGAKAHAQGKGHSDRSKTKDDDAGSSDNEAEPKENSAG
jgi:hypothetical protein